MLIRLLISGILLFSGLSVWAQDSWTLKMDKEGIQVYTRTKASTSLKEFQAHTEIPVSLHSLIAALEDYGTHPDWMYQINSAELLHKEGEQKSILRYDLQLPWPFKAREIITTAIFEQGTDPGSVRLSLNSMPEYIPESEKHVRMIEAGGFCEITSVEPEKVKIVYQYYANPQSVPAWIVNLFVVNGPWETLSALKKRLAKHPYRNLDIPWLHQ